MAKLILQADQISKLYRLGDIGTGSLRQDVKRWIQTSVLRQRPEFWEESDPRHKQSDRPFLWALKDIQFEVEQGDAMGIIGRNGAGKSTLLKILSRIIKPTSGTLKGRGRISSLLEVGTGFHHELTGRENIYLNGYMLGMKKPDIIRQFDAIVDFSGVEKFLDTPIKRYSSGMYVRLAFAVAAHLEPDILIVDEVLAVGDAEFQKKCMGKMKEVSTAHGRTILFVSHNMQAITNLCSKAIWLRQGQMAADGDVHSVVNRYLSSIQEKKWRQDWTAGNAPGNDIISMSSVELIPDLASPENPLDTRTPLSIRFRFHNHRAGLTLSTALHLFTLGGECIFDLITPQVTLDAGLAEASCEIPGHFLNDGSYYISIQFVRDASQPLFYLEECLKFEIQDYRENTQWFGKWQGYVRPLFPFAIRALGNGA